MENLGELVTQAHCHLAMLERSHPLLSYIKVDGAGSFRFQPEHFAEYLEQFESEFSKLPQKQELGLGKYYHSVRVVCQELQNTRPKKVTQS